MPEKTALLTFLIAALSLNIAPGPDMLYVIGRSVGGGRRAGIVSALGIFAGTLVHTLIVALGLAALLRSSSLAFNVIRYAGAAYLFYLGARLLASRDMPIEMKLGDDTLLRIFRQGVITNVLNPKVALFFLAFLPQFVDSRRGTVALQVVFLGMLFNTGGTLVNLGVALAGGRLGDILKRSPGLRRFQRWLSGSIFIGLGVRMAIARRR